MCCLYGLVMRGVLPLVTQNSDVIWARMLFPGSVITVIGSQVMDFLYLRQPFFILILWL